jgi:hypothetical protein
MRTAGRRFLHILAVRIASSIVSCRRNQAWYVAAPALRNMFLADDSDAASRAGHFFSDFEKAAAVQHMLVCVEMGLVFAPLHIYAFSYSDYAGKPLASRKKEQ